MACTCGGCFQGGGMHGPAESGGGEGRHGIRCCSHFDVLQCSQALKGKKEALADLTLMYNRRRPVSIDPFEDSGGSPTAV